MMDEELDPRDGRRTVEDWWDFHHRGRGKHLFWLTGSRGPEVWKYLQVTDHIHPGAVVLNIGVGLGHCTRELVQRGCRVHALDISPVALEKVAQVVERTWLPASLAELPDSHFDLAISNLVAQHMNDRDLLHQLKHVIRALKPGAVFALQFAQTLIPEMNDLVSATGEQCKAGGVCRTLGHISQMVESTGGMIVAARRIGVFPTGAVWFAIQIDRRDTLREGTPF